MGKTLYSGKEGFLCFLTFSPEEETELEICCETELPVKISTLLWGKLSLSGSSYAALVQNGRIASPEGRDLIKGKLKTGIVLRFYPEE